MRRTIIVAINGDVAIGVQLRRLPLAAVVLDTRQRFESGSLDLLEPLTAGDAKAAMRLIVDALDAHHQRTIDLRDRSKSRAAEPEAKVPTQDLDQSLDDRLIPRFSHASRNDRRREVRSQVCVVLVQIGVVQMTFDDARLQAVRHGDVTDAAIILKHPPVAAEPVTALHVLGRPREQ